MPRGWCARLAAQAPHRTLEELEGQVQNSPKIELPLVQSSDHSRAPSVKPQRPLLSSLDTV